MAQIIKSDIAINIVRFAALTNANRRKCYNKLMRMKYAKVAELHKYIWYHEAGRETAATAIACLLMNMFTTSPCLETATFRFGGNGNSIQLKNGIIIKLPE